ncbi:4'-phosphopantetheinyl transferase family protein [Streptomyces sp. enrichment culture]|uniref:4'-phosphopantetheinyl transferase family protein n=1 Tax=Streptomyces sp. enrichment culture TaxID=1795815 RepID=UPI003F56381B
MLGGVLPRGVEVEEMFRDPADVELFPEEAALVVNAVDKRRREFGTVRVCARAALARLGVGAGPILLGPRREPLWPEGVVGSMTHCEGYRAAAVARRGHVVAIGVDAEENAPLPEGVGGAVLLPEEHEAVLALGRRRPDVAWDRLIFSAKESVYKAWFPLTGKWLDFEECVVLPDPERGTFTGTLRVPGPVVAGERIGRFDGRWAVRGEAGGGGHVATAVLVTSGR